MISPDFSDRTYTAEVVRAKAGALQVFQAITRLTHRPTLEDHLGEPDGMTVKLCHAFLPTPRDFHRYPRTIVSSDGNEITIPRRHRLRDKDQNLYDVLIAYHGQHIVLAVPFHELAEEFFVQVHDYLSGRGTRYEKLDITKLVIKLGSSGAAKLSVQTSPGVSELSVTRCHLTYADQQSRSTNLQQIRINGTNLAKCDEYKALIAPVLRKTITPLTVTPIVLGFALLVDGVKKSSAITDLHGNFKLWVAPGLRRLIRVFALLEALESMNEVTYATTNLPILRSEKNREAEE
jgi:hypothetical protein